MIRVQPGYQNDLKDRITRRKDRIVYKSSKEILFLIYLTDPIISSNQEVLKLMKELRKGN